MELIYRWSSQDGDWVSEHRFVRGSLTLLCDHSALASLLFCPPIRTPQLHIGPEESEKEVVIEQKGRVRF